MNAEPRGRNEGVYEGVYYEKNEKNDKSIIE